MSNDSTPVLFPPSRYVGGNPYELADKKDPSTKQVRTYAPGHAKAGQPIKECYLALAIAKAAGQTHWAMKPATWDTNNRKPDGSVNPYWGEIIWNVGHAGFPKLVDPQTRMIQLPTFAWKIEDGDSTIPKGENMIRNCDREGWAGHWIVHVKSGFLPKTFNTDLSPLQEGLIERGFYIELLGSVSANNNAQKPGVYINHNMVVFRAPGPVIRSGPDPRAVGFGSAALPQGVTAAPLGTGFPTVGVPTTGFPPQGGHPVAGVAMPGAPVANGAPAPAGFPAIAPGAGTAIAPAQAAAPVGFPTAQPVQTFPSSAAPTAVQPHPGILRPAGAPALPGAVALPGALPLATPWVLHPSLVQAGHSEASLKAQGVTYEQAKGQGWVA